VPTLTSATPNTGWGGNTVTLAGTGLADVSDVYVGSTGDVVPPYLAQTATQIQFRLPSLPAGSQAIYVFSPSSGPSGSVPFTYVAPPPPTVTAVSPASGPTAGGTSVTVTGTNLTGATQVTFASTPATSVVVVNATTITCVTPAGTAGPANVGVTTPNGGSSMVAGFTYQAPQVPVGPPTAWDGAIWDTSHWQYAPAAVGWGSDWRFWYQVADGAGGVVELTNLVVEARWTTDSHTMGDGTFRGDIQPGTVTVRLWDPGHQLDSLNKLGALWAFYAPTGAAWCWFYDSFTRGVYAAGDPTDADCVYTGTPWPMRATNPRYETNFPVASVNARLNAVVTLLSNAYIWYPHVAANVAGQTQTCAAVAVNSDDGTYESILQVVRDSAATGVAWLSAVGAPRGGRGSLALNYARWETANQRSLDRSQIVAGPSTTASEDWFLNWVGWSAVNGTTGVTTKNQFAPAAVNPYGKQGPGRMRMWGDVSASGPEYNATNLTGQQIATDHNNPSELVLSSIDVQSGSRSTSAGAPSPASWDPYAHTLAPTDTALLTDNAGATKLYRVTKSDHRLTATIWQTTHTLEKFTAPTPLP
jgi:hypothetical protein